jgi:putative redox protein
MRMEIGFPGGKRVDASFGSFVVRTDQPAAVGGDGSAPSPFELFLASLATCAGYYALAFCQARSIPTEGLRVVQTAERDGETHRLTRVQIDIHLPAGFPEHHRDGIRRAAEHCAVKKTVQVAPEFVVNTEIAPA